MSVPRPPSAAWKAGLLGALYFSQGLPFGFFTQALPVLMRKQGYSLGAIGLSSLVAAPWALKFLWAPAVDRYSLARLGRRKSWIVQVVAVAGYAGLALGTPGFLALAACCGAEHFASGMATAALFTCMMDWCSERSGATDYTMQACAVVIATGAASALAGFSAQAFGYFAHFCLAGVLALGAIGAVRGLFPTPDAVRALRE